jgi:hypothetical protein
MYFAYYPFHLLAAYYWVQVKWQNFVGETGVGKMGINQICIHGRLHSHTQKMVLQFMAH